jgi:hypothetical protein
MENEKGNAILVGFLIIVIVALAGFGGFFAYKYFTLQKSPTTQTSDWKNYTNTEFGFSMTFPESWKGYTIAKSIWNGQGIEAPVENTKYSGVLLTIKNPQTTTQQAWQDIPIMVFTPDVWQLIQAEKVSVSAAPLPPAQIGQNAKYVFATPPRWYGFTDAVGFQEAIEIVKTFKGF